MTRRTRRTFLALNAVLMALLLVLFLANLDLAADARPPDDLPGLAKWLARHPADYITAARIADQALDSSLPQRVELWRAAYAHARRLAPLQPNAAVAFVRGGLFHWREIGAADRGAVLAAAGPLLRSNRMIFLTLGRPLWELTRDFDYLRSVAPPTQEGTEVLAELAKTNGLFSHYRDLRERLARERLASFEANHAGKTPAELVAFLPWRIDTRDEPLVRRVLAELHHNPFQAGHVGGNVDGLIDFALRHDLGPLDGLDSAVDAQGKLQDSTRARLALRLGDTPKANQIEIAAANPRANEWIAYFLQRALLEASRGDRSAAEAYLGRASLNRTDDAVLATAERVATMLGDPTSTAHYRRQLDQAVSPWQGICGRDNEICTWAWTDIYGTGAIPIRVEVAQTDEVPPYVEIYVDDALVAEGEVRGERTFSVKGSGLHRLEVRIANPLTRNRIQRRVRLS